MLIEVLVLSYFLIEAELKNTVKAVYYQTILFCVEAVRLSLSSQFDFSV